MPIDINSLFADIIDTPEQRQQKLLQQGMTQGRLLSSNLTGLARAAAPLAQMAGQLGVQRNEDLRRAVQPMLGLDPRTTGERVGEQIAGLDMSTPEGMLQAAQALQSIDPLRAATLRQAAAEQRKADQDRKRTTELQDMQLAAARRQEESALDTEKNRAANVLRYKTLGIPSAFVDSYATGELAATDLMKAWGESLSAKAKVKPFKFTSLKDTDLKTAIKYISTNEEAKNLLEQTREGTGFLGWGGEAVFDEQSLLDEAAVWRSINPALTVTEAVNEAVKSLPSGGARSLLQEGDGIAAQQMQQSYNTATGKTTDTGSVDLSASNAAAPNPDASFTSQVADLVAQAEALRSGITLPPQETPTSSDVNPITPQTLAPSAGISAPRITRSGFDTEVIPQAAGVNQNTLANSRLGTAISSYWDKLNNPEMFEQERAAQAAQAALTPQQQREQAKASDYLKAVENLDFPALPKLAKGIQAIPDIVSAAASTMARLGDRLAAENGVSNEAQKVFDAALDSTANIIGSLVEGQSGASSRESGERVLMQIEIAESNIQAMQRELGKLPASVRSPVSSSLSALKELMISYKKRYNIPTS